MDKERLITSGLVLFTGLVWITVLARAFKSEEAPKSTGTARLVWEKPALFPAPVYDFSRNPLTAQGVKLGRFLFYDGTLSRTGDISCGTCHQQQNAFTDKDRELSRGVDDQLGKRNTPSIQNMAWNSAFFWDGGVFDLDFVPFNPIENPLEMGETVNHILGKIRKMPESAGATDYSELFRAAFGTPEITTERLMKALSQFMVKMVSAESRYDKFAIGDVTALSTEEKQGLILFRKNCGSCHEGQLFTNHSFRNNGLAPVQANDTGRYDVTKTEVDKYKFKVPSLRNIAFTAPYMHDGRYETLEEVLDHYTDKVVGSPTLDSLLIKPNSDTGLNLMDTEKKSIIAFLKSLSDEQFIRNNALSDPRIDGAFDMK